MESESLTDFFSLVKTEWEKLLLVDDINDKDNFFVLGGDSMLGTMLILSLMEATGIELSLGDLYENSTLQELSALVVNRMNQRFGISI